MEARRSLVGGAVIALSLLTASTLSGCSSPEATSASSTVAEATAAVSPVVASAGPTSSAPASTAASTPADSPSSSVAVSPEYSSASIRVTSQKSVKDEFGRDLVLKVKAPKDTRFAVGATEEIDMAAACQSAVLDPDDVLYEVHCPWQGTEKRLFSTISDGDFEYAFVTNLK